MIENPSNASAATIARKSRLSAGSLRSCLIAGLSLALATIAPNARAQDLTPSAAWSSVTTRIETDGSLGGAPAQIISPNSSNIFTVGEEVGERAGSNLFHSFLYFDLGAGDTALFTATQPTENVVSRITGGDPSHLNGTLASEIPGADFYFLNPDGILFGPDAKLVIPAAFHASTAEDLGFDDDRRFAADSSGGGPSILSMAAPADFGFLGDSSQRIVFDSTDVLRGDVDGSLRLHAGGVELRRGAVVVMRDHGVEIVATGSITLSGKDDPDRRGSGIFVVNDFAFQQQPPAGGDILLEANSVHLSDGAAIAIQNRNAAMTQGGSLTIRAADRIVLDGTDDREVEPTSGSALQLGSADLFTETVGGGDGVGGIRLEAPHVSILDGADITTFRLFGTASDQVGSIEIRADQRLELAGIGGDGIGSRVRGANRSVLGGTPGSVRAEVGTLLLRDGGTLASNNAGDAAGGDVSVIATRLVSISGQDTSGGEAAAPQSSTLQAAQTNSVGKGNGGNVTVEAPRIELAEGGQILALSDGNGDAGSVTLSADEVRLSSGAVVSVEANAADGGDLTIRGSALVVLEDSRLEASVQGGEGGSILIGDSGAPAEALILAGESRIDASAGETGGQGGRVEVNAQAVFLSGDSEITASAPGGPEAQGQVILNNPETAIESQVIPPNVSYLDASSMLLAQCGRQPGGAEDGGGRFTVARWPGLPLSAEGPLLAFSPLGAEPSAVVAGPEDEEYAVYQLAMRSGGDALRGGKAVQAANAFGRARDAVAAEGDAGARGDALRGLAQARQASGSYQESLEPLEKALSLARAAADRAREAAALGALGNAYVALGQFDPAEELLREAVDVARGGGTSAEAGDAVAPALRAALLNNLGNQQALSGNAPGALEAYEESAREAREAGEWLRGAQAEANAARTALGLGQREQTRSALLRARVALAQAEATGAEQTALHIHLASSEAALARQDPASRRAALLAAHGDLLRASRAAEMRGDDRTASHALGNLGALYAQEGGRSREARYLTRRAVALAEKAQAADLLVRWYEQLGKVAWENGEVDAALDAYRRAVSLLEQTRPEAAAAYVDADLAFRRAVEPIYLALVDLLLRTSTQVSTPQVHQRRLAEARHVVEQWKAAELRNYFRDSCAAELQATARSVETVDPGAAVVYPIVLADRVELLVSRASGIARFQVAIPASQLEREVRHFRQLLAKRTTREYQVPAQQLYEWLVAPYASLLESEKIDTLVFVPGGVLRTIPMAALHDGEGFLLERYAVAITPGLDLLAPKPLDPSASQLLLAGVSEAVQGYRELPMVERELGAIEALYGGTVLLNASFDAESLGSALRNQRPGVVHLATHAEFTGDPDTSFVLTHDDRLSMEDLTSLMRSVRYGEEPVELLVLSACETAVGDERAALGLAGVAIRAGARSAMGSLWSVSDEATAHLVVGFYEALATPGISKARALREAQKTVMADARFQHPYYWAPFLVINNWL